MKQAIGVKLIRRSQLLLFLCVGLFSCNKKPLPSLQPFNDHFQIFMHRVNDPEEAIVLLPNYAGVELDVFFDYANQCFIVKHDKEFPSNITLEKYFSVCQKFPNAKYWIDFKNLKFIHSLAPIARLNYLDQKFNIKDRIIIESKEAEKLSNIGREGFYTSFWTTSINGKNTSDVVNSINQELTTFQFNALSGREDMAPIFHKYYSNYTHNYWTIEATNELPTSEMFLKENKPGILLVDDREIYKKVKLPKQ